MEDKFTCFIIDDEGPAHEVLTYLINKVPWLELTGQYYNAIDALEATAAQKPNLIFLDVNMPELTGVEFLDSLTTEKPLVIMTTAHPEYAINGFQHDAIAFLLKPVSIDKFLKAVNKARSWNRVLTSPISKQIKKMNGEPLSQTENVDPSYSVTDSSLRPGLATDSNNDSIWVRSDRKLVRLRYEDILYIEGLKDYVKIHSKNGVVITHGNVSTTEALLPKSIFVRVHRSFIVNKNAVKMIEGNTLIMSNDRDICMTSQNREEVIRQIVGKDK